MSLNMASKTSIAIVVYELQCKVLKTGRIWSCHIPNRASRRPDSKNLNEIAIASTVFELRAKTCEG